MGQSVACIATVLAGGLACASCLVPDAHSASGTGESAAVSASLKSRRLEVTSFTCTPDGTIHVGDTLVFTAQIAPVQIRAVGITAVNDAPIFYMHLHDDGNKPDKQAGDNIYSGRVVWREEYGTGDTMIVLAADGNKEKRRFFGEAELLLKVLPKELAPRAKK